MRLAYFAQISGAPGSGVMHKVRAQLEGWRRDGHHARLFLLTRDDPAIWRAHIPDTDARAYHDAPSRFAAMARLAQGIRRHQPDLVYQRYFPFYPTMLLLPRVPVVVEVNTDDTMEYPLSGRTRALYNQATRRLVLGRARAIVYVATELRDRPSFQGFGAEAVVITNGIALSDYPVLPAPANPEPRLVFVGSPSQPWQGFDKVVRLASLRPGWRFDVVGTRAEGSTPDNITWHGQLDRHGVLSVLATADVGLGTLALHRKGLREASPLKVREYLAVGLPIIYGHDDPDADVLDEGALRISNRESNIEDDLEAIDAFVSGHRGFRVPREAVDHLDQAAKERQRLSLFERLISEGRR